MKIVRRTRIAVRTDERLLIRKSTVVLEESCDGCRSEPDLWMDRERLPRETTVGGRFVNLLNSLARIGGYEHASKKEKAPCKDHS
ncbi:MAG: hypothetical protein ABSH47_17535 [Bryobacteraceae bacterium]|jgi:hypothetical protein